MNKQHQDITEVLNTITTESVRWCTPSILSTARRVRDPYASDMSVSFQKLGMPSEPSGMFLEAYIKAAKAYKSDKTLFSVSGSTGSNFIVLRALSKQIPNLRVLAARNIHKSILAACEDYDTNLHFIDSQVDHHLQIFLPPLISDVMQAIERTKPHVLLLTNPTYEGLVLDLKKLIKIVHQTNPELIIFVDEAWGAHLIFSDKLPPSSMECGVDVCVQSTHKLGGALQQTGLIHWKEKRINTQILMESFRSISTTSPSYTLLASIDAARSHMEKHGNREIEKSMKIASKLSKQLNNISGFKVVTLAQLEKTSEAVFGKDEIRVILDVEQSGFTGFTLSRILEEKYNIIVEKYNATTILFLVPFQNCNQDVERTVGALKNITEDVNTPKNGYMTTVLETPGRIPRRLGINEVARLLRSQIEAIPLKEAKGRISAENITPYPPGIPTTIQGEVFTSKVLTYYEGLKYYPNSHIVANDITLETVLVVK